MAKLKTYHLNLEQFFAEYGNDIDDRITPVFNNIRISRDKHIYMADCKFNLNDEIQLDTRIIANRYKDTIKFEFTNLSQHNYYLLRKKYSNVRQDLMQNLKEWFNCIKPILFQIREA